MASMDVEGSAPSGAVGFDLDAIVSRYVGASKVLRLRHVADKRPDLATRALTLALQEVKATTLDTATYELLAQRLSSTGFVPDSEWVRCAQKKALEKKKAVEHDLQVHMNQAIRESIRRAFLDKAQVEVERGDFSGAKTSLFRAREYTPGLRAQAELALSLLDLSVLTRDWDNVRSVLVRPELSPGQEAAQNVVNAARICIAAGYLALADGRYGEAADRLLSLPPAIAASSLTKAYDAGLGGGGDTPVLEVGHPEDVAPVAILCAFASYDRARLHALSSSPASKALLEVCPSLRDALQAVVGSRHASALATLHAARPELEVEWALPPTALSACYGDARRSILTWHMGPYTSLSLHALGTALSLPTTLVEEEVVGLINKGVISGRIDGVSKVFSARLADPRSTAHKALTTTKRALLAEARVVLLRAALERGLALATAATDAAHARTAGKRVGGSKRTGSGNGRSVGHQLSGGSVEGGAHASVALPGQVSGSNTPPAVEGAEGVVGAGLADGGENSMEMEMDMEEEEGRHGGGGGGWDGMLEEGEAAAGAALAERAEDSAMKEDGHEASASAAAAPTQ